MRVVTGMRGLDLRTGVQELLIDLLSFDWGFPWVCVSKAPDPDQWVGSLPWLYTIYEVT